ncbi:MAG: PadR family transcriptional regulator [Candidatus Aminicenantes bacterium]|nr:PadR family transcriptional regulator [Candidatus Aminicenantes bacterium]
MKELTLSQLTILLAILRLKDNAYGVTIRRQIHEVTGKAFPYGTLYSFLELLHKKGYVEKFIGGPTKKRGGRRKILYKPTKKGLEALQAAQKLQKALWRDIPEKVV